MDHDLPKIFYVLSQRGMDLPRLRYLARHDGTSILVDDIKMAAPEKPSGRDASEFLVQGEVIVSQGYIDTQFIGGNLYGIYRFDKKNPLAVQYFLAPGVWSKDPDKAFAQDFGGASECINRFAAEGMVTGMFQIRSKAKEEK